MAVGERRDIVMKYLMVIIIVLSCGIMYADDVGFSEKWGLLGEDRFKDVPLYELNRMGKCKEDDFWIKGKDRELEDKVDDLKEKLEKLEERLGGE
jgi:hypothetical protein